MLISWTNLCWRISLKRAHGLGRGSPTAILMMSRCSSARRGPSSRESPGRQPSGQRKLARKKWEQDRLARAATGDWQAFREYKRQGPVGWEIDYAEAQSSDVHESVHDHLKQVYAGLVVTPYPDTATHATAFTVEELQAALVGLKTGKSVGIDLTSAELLQGLVSVKGGMIHLLEFFNRVLTTRDIPRAWNRPLVVLLPKVPAPTSATQLRPIALGSRASKLFAKMLLARVKHLLGFQTHAQCAGSGRQASGLLFSLFRLLELSREWGLPVALLQIEVSKAFDSLSRQALLDRLHEKLGDSAEFFCLQALLHDVRATIQTLWGCRSWRWHPV